MKKMVWWVGNKLSRTNPLYVMGLVLLYLLVIWLACFLIDVRNLMGLREILVIKDYLVMEGEKVPLWFFVFREAGPTEILQWMILLGTVACSTVLSWKLKKLDMPGPSYFWKLISIMAVLMFLEDAANIRHLVNYIIFQAGGLEWSSEAGKWLRNVLELIYFAVLASIPLYAFVRFSRYIFSVSRARSYLILGYVSYGVAVVASGTRFFNHWYQRAGEIIYRFMDYYSEGELIKVATDTLSMEFWLMDLIVEESLELIGAGALLAAVIAYGSYVKEENNKPFNCLKPEAQ